MTDKLLLDTSILIDFLRQREKKKTVLYKLAAKNTELSISIITHTELYAGKSVWENKQALKELETLFEGITTLPLTPTVSEKAGQIRATTNCDLFDAIIAATSIVSGLELVTLNVKHFKVIKGLKVYNI